MRTTGKILIAVFLSMFMVALAVESEARRGNYRGPGYLSRSDHFKSGHKRYFHRGHYKRSPKNRYRYGHYKSSYKHYYGYGAKYRYGHQLRLHGHKHYGPRLYYGRGFNFYLGNGVYGRYKYGKYHPFRYPHWRSYFHKSFKTKRYFADYSVW